jgi:hypothetical protein
MEHREADGNRESHLAAESWTTATYLSEYWWVVDQSSAYGVDESVHDAPPWLHLLVGIACRVGFRDFDFDCGSLEGVEHECVDAAGVGLAVVVG